MKIFTTDSSTITGPNGTSDSSSLSSSSFSNSSTITGPNGTSDSSSFSNSTSSMRRLKAMEMMAVAQQGTALPPVCTVDFRNPAINANNAQVSSYCAFYNRAYGNSWLLHCPGQSFLQVEADFHKDPSRSYSLDLVHLSSLVNGQPLASVTIEVNGQVVKAGYNPNNGNYIKDSFDITPYLVEGKNVVRINFDANSRSNYWIQSLAIQAK